MSVIAQFLGVVLIASGLVAIFRRSAKGSPEFEDERGYRGRSAVMLGIVWIVLGAAFLLFPALMG